MYHQLARAYFQLDRDPKARVGLVYAVGPHFTSGLELTDWAGPLTPARISLRCGNEIDPFYIMSDVRCRKPIVLAVQVIVIPGALSDAQHGYSGSGNRYPVRHARSSPRVFPRRRRYAAAAQRNRLGKRYALYADRGPNERDRGPPFGLVQRLTEPGEQFDKALELAKRVASAAPLGVQTALKSCRLAALQGEEAAKAIINQDMKEVMKSEDMKEGLQSFIERRAAVFQGK